MFLVFVFENFKRIITKTISKKKGANYYKHSFLHYHQWKSYIYSILFHLKKFIHQLQSIHEQQLRY